MVAKSKLDPQHERYRSRGALITLPHMLIQRQAAKALAYVSHARSIAGISGLHLSKIRGRGIDFEEFRPYQAGDDIRLIDWRATARTGRAVTKVFREERERPAIIAVDQCSSMFFGSQVAFKSVIAAQAAALFCWLAIDNGDRVGGRPLPRGPSSARISAKEAAMTKHDFVEIMRRTHSPLEKMLEMVHNH